MTTEQHYLGNQPRPARNPFVELVAAEERTLTAMKQPTEDDLTPFFSQCYEAEQHTLAAMRHLQNGEPEAAEPELRLAQARITTAKKITERQKEEVKAIQSAMDRMSFEGQTVKSAEDFHRAGFRVIEVD